MDLEWKLKLVTTSPVGGWTKTKLMLISTHVEVVIEVELVNIILMLILVARMLLRTSTR